MDKIDHLDKKILEIISCNARLPFKDVAAECGISRTAIHNTWTYVGITLERGSMYKEVVKEFLKIPEIVECHFTTGPYTMLIKLYARDNAHLMELLNNCLQEIPGVTATETLISLKQSIKKEVPIGNQHEESVPQKIEED